MAKPQLGHSIQIWISEIEAATLLLIHDYRAMQDPLQLGRALKLSNQVNALGKSNRMTPLVLAQLQIHKDETQRELECWRMIVRGLAGICTVFAMVDHDNEAKLIRSKTARANQSLGLAMKGFRTAFPKDLVEAHLPEILASVATACSRACKEDLESSGAKLNADFEAELLQTIQETLAQALTQSD